MSSIMKGIIDEAEAFDYDRLKAMPAKERIAYLRDKPELRNLYNAEHQKRIDAILNNYSWMTPEEKAHYEKLAAADDTSQGMQSKSFSAEKYLKQLFQQKMDAKKAASMLKVHWAPLEDLQKYLTGQISTKTELSAYLAKSPKDLGKVRWGSGTIGIVVDGHITIGGRGDLGSDQYKTVNGVRGQQKYTSRPGQIDPTFDTLDLGKHHEVLVDNWKIREIVLPPDIPENVDAIIKKAGIPVRRLANQEQPINEEELDENLRKWFKEKWVRFGPDGKIRGSCARGSEGEGKPKCLPQKKAQNLGKKGRASAARRKRREDPNPERRGKAKNVATKKKTNEDQDRKCPHCGGPLYPETMINEKKDACYHKVRSRYKVWPSAYASGALVQCRKKGAANWGTGGKKKNESSIMKGLVDETAFEAELQDSEPRIVIGVYGAKSKEFRKKFRNQAAQDRFFDHPDREGNFEIHYVQKADVSEGVIIGHDANDPEVAVLGGAGSYKLSNLKKKAQMEANELAKDVSEGKFKNSAYNVKQLANTLNTIVAAEEEMEKNYFGEDYTGMFAAEKTAATNPYGGQKDRQFRGAISETPTDNPTGASGEGGWRKYKPKSAGTLDESRMHQYNINDAIKKVQEYHRTQGSPYRGAATRLLNALYQWHNTEEDNIVTRAQLLRTPNMGKQAMALLDTLLGNISKDESPYDQNKNQAIAIVDSLKQALAGDDLQSILDLMRELKNAIGTMHRLSYKRVREDTAYAGGMGQGGNAGESYRKFKPKSAGTFKEEEQLDEKCWDSHKQVGMKKKGGKMVPNCVPKESAIMKGIKR